MTRWHSCGLVLAVLAGCGPRAAPEPIVIGHLAPLTGADRTAGEHAQQGVQLAVAEARAAHLEAGGRPLAVVHADTGGEPEQVGAETVRLLTVNKVPALLAGPRAAAAERVLRADQVYGAAVVVPAELADSAASPWVRALGARPASRGRALARYAARDLKGSRAVVVLDNRDAAATAVATAFRKEWPGGAAAVEERTYSSAADAAERAAQAARARPDVILLAVAPGEFRSLYSALADGGFRRAVLYGGEDAGPMTGGRDGGPDLYLATVYCPEKLTARGQEFARRYEADNHEPPDLYAAQAYDGACLLFGVLSKAKGTDPAAVRQELERTETFETVTGTVTWKDHRARRAFFLLHVQGGKTTVAQTVEPEAD
jgi:branched-chain amino acid transport system substrate-binding protein